MKIIVAYGQGNGYGDGKVYVVKPSEFFFGHEKPIVAIFTDKNGVDITEDAIAAFKYGGWSEWDSIKEFLNVVHPKLKIFYSKGFRKKIRKQ
ncbi:MAG: hypothetical protein FWC41_11520 [Firmicutes bacterium]|nr:hypothetical protein [Bacillota bacterium]